MPNPEELARQNIDRQLIACGWIIQDRQAANLYTARGAALRALHTTRGADFLLSMGRKPAFESPERSGLVWDLRATLEQISAIAEELGPEDEVEL